MGILERRDVWKNVVQITNGMSDLDYFLRESFCFGQLFCFENFWPFGARKKILSFGRFLSGEPHWSVLTWIMQINNNSSLTQWSKMHQSEQQKSLFWQKMVLLGKKVSKAKLSTKTKSNKMRIRAKKVSSKKYLDGKERKRERERERWNVIGKNNWSETNFVLMIKRKKRKKRSLEERDMKVRRLSHALLHQRDPLAAVSSQLRLRYFSLSLPLSVTHTPLSPFFH